MQGIIQNLVAKVLSIHRNFMSNQQTMDLYLTPEPTFRHPWPTGTQTEGLSSLLLYRYPNAEVQLRCHGRDFMVRDSVACPPRSSAPPSPSRFILEYIVSPSFPLPGLEVSPATNLVLVV